MTRLRCGAIFACAGAARERDAYAGRALRVRELRESGMPMRGGLCAGGGCARAGCLCGAGFARAGAARERALRGMRAAGDKTGKIARGRGKFLDAAEKIWYYNLVIVYAVYAPRGDCDFLRARSSAG